MQEVPEFVGGYTGIEMTECSTFHVF